jgi:hypothetical protein
MRVVPDSRLACRPHWWQLPHGIRSRIWTYYRPGQTIVTASPAYLDALQDAMAFWTSHNEGVKT